MGLVWNYLLDPLDPPNYPGYRFEYTTDNNMTADIHGNPRDVFRIIKRDLNGMDHVLLSDDIVYDLDEIQDYTFRVERNSATPNNLTVTVSKGGHQIFLHTALDNDPLLAEGAIGFYVDNIQDGQWGKANVVPEPSSVTLAAMGGMGTMVFLVLRQLRHRKRYSTARCTTGQRHAKRTTRRG